MNGMKLLLLALFLLLAAATADAATYWVSQSSNGSRNCFNSATQPSNLAIQTSPSIISGIGCLKSGDTLYVMAGTYQGSWGARRTKSATVCDSVCVPNGPGTGVNPYTTVSAAPGHEGKVITTEGGGRPIVFYGYDIKWIKIANLVIDARKNSTYAIEQSCIASKCDHVNYNYAHHMLYENNEIRNALGDCILGFGHSILRGGSMHGCGTHGVYLGAIGRNNLIENVYFHDIGGLNSLGVPIGYCVHYYDSNEVPYNNTVRNSLFNRCSAGAITTGASHYGRAMYGYIYNNTFADNQYAVRLSSAQYFWVFNNSFCCARNNADRGQKDTILVQDSRDVIIRNNVSAIGQIWLNGTNNQRITVSDNYLDQTADAPANTYVDYANNNFTLKPGIAPINTGFTPPTSYYQDGTRYDYDTNGVARPRDGAWDKGACEWFKGASRCPSLQLTSTPR